MCLCVCVSTEIVYEPGLLREVSGCAAGLSRGMPSCEPVRTRKFSRVRLVCACTVWVLKQQTDWGHLNRGVCLQTNACVRVSEAGGFCVSVTRASLAHAHKLSKPGYQRHTSTRVALTEDLVDTVDLLRNSGAKQRTILRHIVENSDAVPNLTDIGNLIVRLKKRETSGLSTVRLLHKWMLGVCEEEARNVGRILTDAIATKVSN